MSEGTPFEDILPLDVTGSEGELLGKLCYFIELVAHWRETLEQPRSAVEWGQVISELIDAFFDPRGDEELDLATVRSAMVTLASNVEATGFEGDLTPRMVREWIEGELSDARQGRGFVSGGITFATLVPMRSIPFKVVCLLGMNDDSYPREDRPVEFDLMYREGLRKGDRSRRVDDRYLFLEALLSARHCLYISYEGRGIKDNQEKPPSILVSELLEYLERVFIGRSPVVVHPLQPFSPSYYRGDPRLVTYRDEWYDALVTPSAGDDFVGDGVPPQEDLAPDELGKLTAFFRNPAQYYLRNRLGVYFEEDDIELRETESFALDGLERYQLADGALQALVHGEDIAMWEARERCSGLVMPGPEGARQLARESARAQMVFDAVREHQGIPVPPVRAALAVGEYSIEGVVDYLYTNDDGTRSIINFRTGTLRKRQLLDAWVRHLFANATQGEVDTLLVSTDGEKVVENRIGAMAAADARQLIETLIGFYLEGLSSPLAFMPETSHAFAKATLEGEPDRKIVERTLSEWTRDMPGSEGTDRSYQRLFTWPDSFGEAFRQTALAIYVPLLEALGDAK
ncbi:MAG: exodeoxyribonuclease V subunit gamma, partial [Pseudomonadales bacterium]|nr:exodeoxyribonuclease V subunit gamma [Pseudomonadales bacterium]